MVGGYGYWRSVQPPADGSPLYESVVKAFYSGTTALEAGDTDHATTYLTQVTRLAPREPAGWINLGILQIRLGNYEAAQKSLEEAKRLAPNNARIEGALADIELAQGRSDDAVSHLKRVLELDPGNIRTRYTLAQTLSNTGDTSSSAQVSKLLDEILKAQPNNLVVLLDSLRLASSSGDEAGFRAKLKTLHSLSGKWTGEWANEQKEALNEVDKAAKTGARAAAIPLISLSNLLKPSPAYQAALGVFGADSQTGIVRSAAPLEGFLWLKPSTPHAFPAAPDLKLAFSQQPFSGFAGKANFLSAFLLDTKATPVVLAANGAQVQRVLSPAARFPFPSKSGAPVFGGIAALDWNYDFRQDVALAGSSGLRLMEQNASGAFKDATAKWKLPPAILNGDYIGEYAFDIEADGDLDLIVAPRQGEPFVVRNNGDESALVVRPFAGLKNVRQFAWGDFDDDGAVDVAFLDEAGQIHVAMNERVGAFRLAPPLAAGDGVAAIAAADLNRDGMVDLLAWRRSGELIRFSMNASGGWDSQSIMKVAAAQNEARLFVGDMDNNGALDVMTSSGGATQIELADEKGGFVAAPALSVGTFGVLDLNSDGKLDLVGIDAKGQPVQLLNHGPLNYGWQNLRPIADEKGEGNQRINPFGVGGTLEIRSGLLYQKQQIDGPQIHFGTGGASSTNSLRIVWPNGAPQSEFELKVNQNIEAKQRLTGSCPFLWAFDGKKIAFVKDCNWRSPLGLRINGQDTAGVVQTQDWIKVEGDKVAVRDGQYDLRVSADLWEAHMFDYVGLQVVDHPANTEMWVDERFSVPMPPLGYTLTGEEQPVQKAVDERGTDVSATVAKLDGEYLDTFGRGQYQGVTRDHFVEVELPANAPRNGPLWLLAQGWLHPTDSSINVALSQGKHSPPRDLSLEVADGHGGWKVVKPHMGFPAGKNKTILVDLQNAFVAGAPRRARLRTNLEIYWDRISWAGAPPVSAKANSKRLLADVADLRFRGVSPMNPKNASSPELPGAYEQVSYGQQWRDLVGFYTRFGDVRPLLQKVDDRYVLMNAGDEMRLRFKALAPVPKGWKRDFIFISDGWTKDGNLNTAYSKTLLPLPLHSQPLYSKAPVPLEQDPAYRLHPRDWQDFHTRWVGTNGFRMAMQPQPDRNRGERPQMAEQTDAANVHPVEKQPMGGHG